MRLLSLMLLLLLPCVIGQEPPVAGSLPGTERWLIELRSREDTGSPSQAMSWPSLGGGYTVLPGWGLVMGLAPASNVSTTARLQVFGEPCLGQTFLFDLTQGAPLLGAFLLGGFFGQAPYFPNPVCDQFVQNPNSLFAPTDAAGHETWTFVVPSNASMLFTELAFQVLIPQPPAGVVSNGILVRVGGVL